MIWLYGQVNLVMTVLHLLTVSSPIKQKGRLNRLLFISASKKMGEGSVNDLKVNLEPIERDLKNLTAQFPEYSAHNTIVVSPFHNLLPEYVSLAEV